jgi:archaemetzincin
VKSVYIVALGMIGDDVLTAIGQGLASVYGIDVNRLPPRAEPEDAFDAQRKQYSSAHILRQLVGSVPEGAMSMLAVTRQDLFIPMLSFVLGQAQLGAPAAVISLARLHQEFYGLPPDQRLVVERAVKEAVHEVGHTVGLTHCANNTCPMSLSNNVFHVDIKGAQLCSSCALLFEAKTNLPRPSGTSPDGAAMRKL